MAKKIRKHGEWSFTQRKKDGLWTARKQFGVRANGQPNIKALYGKTITEVKKKARDFELSIYAHSPEVIAKTVVYDYIRNYIRTYKYYTVKRTTYDGMEDTIEARIKPFDIAFLQMCNLNVETCQKFINELTQCEKKYSLATIKKTYNLMNNCFRFAAKTGDIPYNPMELVNLPTKDMVQKQKKEMRFFSSEQIAVIVEECRKKFKNGVPVHKYGDMIILMLYTGIRIGECIGLTWDDVDLKGNQICINNTVSLVKTRDEDADRKYVMTDTTPKTDKSNRHIPLAEMARAALLSTKENRQSRSKYIFVTKTGNLIRARNVQRTFESILKNCGIACYKEYSLHCLRHTFVSLLLKQKVEIKIISELLGHEKVSTTYDIYAHIMPDQKVESIKVLDSLDLSTKFAS